MYGVLQATCTYIYREMFGSKDEENFVERAEKLSCRLECAQMGKLDAAAKTSNF